MKKNKKLYYSEHDGFEFKTKKELIEHLKNEFDEYTTIADNIVNQLEDLKINPFK